jgi:cytosine/adenosine deaminase-related metal-dependent hydrolase
MDPESGLDAVRHVGIRGGTVASISETPLDGALVLDATGLVVAPGFIDLNNHDMGPEHFRQKAADGMPSRPCRRRESVSCWSADGRFFTRASW